MNVILRYCACFVVLLRTVLAVNMKFVTLNNGQSMPLLGLGTWKSDPGVVKAAVKEAIRQGYRHIDCAAFYLNEKEIGQAFKECLEEGLCKREDLFITSKLWCHKHYPEDVIPALQETLRDLQLDYLDMYLIHWPIHLKKNVSWPKTGEDFVSYKDLPLETTWAAMEECVDKGLTKGIGVSNFSPKKLRDLLSKCRIPPAIDQVERHPYLGQSKLLNLCKEKGIHLTCFSSLGSMDRPAFAKAEDEPILLEDPVIGKIAKKIGATPAQVILKWCLDTGTSTIPKSVRAERLAENLASVDVEIPANDLAELSKLCRRRRYVNAKFWEFEGAPAEYATADAIFDTGVP